MEVRAGQKVVDLAGVLAACLLAAWVGLLVASLWVAARRNCLGGMPWARCRWEGLLVYGT